MRFATHAWIQRNHFPRGGDSSINHYILHFDKPPSVQELLVSMAEILKEFFEELGIEFGIGMRILEPLQVDQTRFVIEGPKGFSVLEIDPAFTEEEFNQINKGKEEHIEIDEKVWGNLFGGGELPKEANGV